MKPFIFLIGYLLMAQTGFTQDSTFTISSTNIDSVKGKILFDATKWVFKKGNNIAWAATNIDSHIWEKISPEKLTIKDADDNGRVEGWFRIKIKIDSSLGKTPLRLYSNAWAASDIYLNGQLIKSFGNTGTNTAIFKEYNFHKDETVPLILEVEKEYTLAWHFVDYINPLIPGTLKSGIALSQQWLYLTTPAFEVKHFKRIIISRTYDGILISVTVVLSLMFWLIAFLNRDEKNLKWIAAGSSFLALLSISVAFSRVDFLSYSVNAIFFNITNLAVVLIFISNPVILANIFHRTLGKAIKIILISCGILVLSFLVFQNLVPSHLQDPGAIMVFACILISMIISFYYLLSSWKYLHGAQWAVVVGFLISVVSLSIYALGSSMGFIQSQAALMTGVMFYTFSPPLGMLVYVSVRFKEIIKEMRISSEQVLHLSEEKRRQAIDQQKILEEEVDRQTAYLKNTLADLKSTQSQLIQSEKMASLGELTAGIAHEIQNPLNFVNNFSEVSKELLDEMKTELDNGNTVDALEIANDVIQNLEKINHHGKRADAIVKGMLQHSRSSSNQKEPSDINALCDEYLRLSYHGLRAKDKQFNATLNTDFDKSIGNINIIPQDIGRVILNLLTNAFYAVQEQGKSSFQNLTSHYQPTVSISTKKEADKVLITVSDNGPGIPQNIVDKIFQPFFTTKPTGQGTGLGLSMSYDIVTKGHGGELKVETKEGEGSTFIIQLPIAKNQ